MLQIDENWRIRSSDMCWVLETRLVNQETFEEYWQNRGYYVMLEDALRGFCNRVVRPSKSVFELLDALEKLNTTIREVCAKAGKEDKEELDFLA